MDEPNENQPRPKRRPRYSGKNPRRFEDKYKERNPELYPDTVAKVIASGKTPAGTHRPIMVAEILEVLHPAPGEVAVDCTLGFGGHASEILKRILPGGRLIGLDVDPFELPRTEARLKAIDADAVTVVQSNFAGLPKAIGAADIILADLGVSSMQLDEPARGFSFKLEGPLDMRMNPNRGQPASALLARLEESELAELLANNSDEPHARELAAAIHAQRDRLQTTTALTALIRQILARWPREEAELSVRRVFQALRMEVNGEMSALDSFLRVLPACLNPGGRVAILTFHSGEDRRVKAAFKQGREQGIYSAIAEDVMRPSADEVRSNPRAGPAKLRWAIRA